MAPLLFVATGQGSHLITKGRQQGHGCETSGAVAHGLVLIQPGGQGVSIHQDGVDGISSAGMG